jgi:hypothetical protein
VRHYRIDFQNRRGGVFVAEPFGFLAPSEWGEPTSHRYCTEQEEQLVITGSIRWMPIEQKTATVRLDRNRTHDLLAIARNRLLALSNEPRLVELEHELTRCDLAGMAASADERKILKGRRELVVSELAELRARRDAEREHVLGKISELEGLRS